MMFFVVCCRQLQPSFQHQIASCPCLRSTLTLTIWTCSWRDVSSLSRKDYEHVWCWHGGGHSSITNAAGMKTAGIRALENSISINAGFKARLDTAVSVSSLNGKTEVLKLSPEGARGLAAQSIHESPLCFPAFGPPLSRFSLSCCLSSVFLCSYLCWLHSSRSILCRSVERQRNGITPMLSCVEKQFLALSSAKVKMGNDDRVWILIALDWCWKDRLETTNFVISSVQIILYIPKAEPAAQFFYRARDTRVCWLLFSAT